MTDDHEPTVEHVRDYRGWFWVARCCNWLCRTGTKQDTERLWHRHLESSAVTDNRGEHWLIDQEGTDRLGERSAADPEGNQARVAGLLDRHRESFDRG